MAKVKAKAKAPAKKPAAKKPSATKSSLKTTLVDTPPRKTHEDKKAAMKQPEGPVLRTLRTVIYPARDLAKSKEFYVALTGKGPYFDQPYYVGFDVGGFELGLDPDLSKVTAGRSGAVAYWRVERIGPTCDLVRAHGGVEVDAPHDVGGGIQTAIYEDPSGNLVGIIEMP